MKCRYVMSLTSGSGESLLYLLIKLTRYVTLPRFYNTVKTQKGTDKENKTECLEIFRI